MRERGALRGGREEVAADGAKVVRESPSSRAGSGPVESREEEASEEEPRMTTTGGATATKSATGARKLRRRANVLLQVQGRARGGEKGKGAAEKRIGERAREGPSTREATTRNGRGGRMELHGRGA